jgi:hypothetical protein
VFRQSVQRLRAGMGHELVRLLRRRAAVMIDRSTAACPRGRMDAGWESGGAHRLGPPGLDLTLVAESVETFATTQRLQGLALRVPLQSYFLARYRFTGKESESRCQDLSSSATCRERDG